MGTGINCNFPWITTIDRNDTVTSFRIKAEYRISVTVHAHGKLQFIPVPIGRSTGIHPEWSAKLIAVFKEYLACSEAKGYDERAKKGLIRPPGTPSAIFRSAIPFPADFFPSPQS